MQRNCTRESASSKNIRVLLVDDHTIFRAGLKRLLEEEANMNVVAETSDAGEAIQCLRTGTFDLMLLDINMKGRSGLDILPSIKREYPELPVIVLSMYPAEQYALRAFKAGASGYIAKDMDPADLIVSVHKVAAGGTYFPPELTHVILTQIDTKTTNNPYQQLSSREFEILLLIVKGNRLTDIGKQLYLSVKTVSTYRSRILSKLNITSNAELVQFALRHHLID